MMKVTINMTNTIKYNWNSSNKASDYNMWPTLNSPNSERTMEMIIKGKAQKGFNFNLKLTISKKSVLK